ncbi:stonustoxin subunit alpha-like [Megalobrama amblycephala]|uniref:stonustoxin subunit alpha-like n=1 Tax=Megalobrama amblycephala TaxID=75352 RepID=UPI00201452A6|nr:stonustoxin subunit alpha-like [Megalobrama amblycephala]XP_048041661.1 stonustoxin subunit alpha-like [Megalobrama amblycephala]
MKFRVAVLLLLYKCLVFAPNVIFATESDVSGLTCPLKTCTDVLKELKDLEIRLAKSETQIEEIKKEKQDIVPRTRKGFLQYSRLLTPDLNSMNKYLRLSENNTVITNVYPELQSYTDHPDRFDLHQVLCRESVSDRRSYWEVEWSVEVDISVSYKSISRNREGRGRLFGTNDQSWSLRCFSSSYSFLHNKRTDLPVKPIISRTVNGKNYYRVGVYVDHSAGTLSFYSVSGDTMSLIHTVQTTFTQPLYPGFGMGPVGSSVKLF